jgi:PAS domain-containing protein
VTAGQRPFPDLLQPAFDAAALEEVDSHIAVIDANGNILWVNRAWRRFAHENGAVGDPDAWPSYFDVIAPPLRDFYQEAFSKALATGGVFDHEYECSSPEKRRVFRLRALPIDARALLLEHSLVTEVDHEAMSHEAFEARYLREDGTFLQCSHCRRVCTAGAQSWDWVRQWAATSHPMTSHGICPSCVGFYWGRSAAK